MDNKDCITPMLLFGPGQCIKCGGQITVVDMETSFMRLSNSGNPISEDTMIKCEGVCMNCGNRVPMMRDGYNYIPENEYTKLVKEYNKKEFMKAAQDKMDRLKPTKENPFCLNIERQE